MRAMILQARGRPAEALASCARLLPRTAPLIVAACSARPAQLAGRGEQARQVLARALDSSAGSDTALVVWAYRNLARITEADGHLGSAEDALKRALAADPEDAGSLLDYQDFLLRRGRPGAVTALSKGRRSTPMLELRLAEAERRLEPNSPSALGDRIARLRSYFETREALGDRRHLREAARAYLNLFDDPNKALELALANWSVQRETEDAHLLLSAARACGRPETAEPVHGWIAQEGIVGFVPGGDRVSLSRTREADHVSF
jgi:tetratricopeptide (TPR) repeat protein